MKKKFAYKGEIDVSRVEKSKEMTDASNELILYLTATHSDMPINMRIYTVDELKKAAKTFLEPYEKPVLSHHNSIDGEPLGRVIDAMYMTRDEWMTFSEDKRFEDKKFPEQATGAVVLKVKITDSTAIKKINDKRYKTLSIGFVVEDLVCSICGESQFDGECEHELGEEYDGETMYYLAKGMEFTEISFVNVPADGYATVNAVSTEEEEETEDETPENDNQDKSGELPLAENQNKKGVITNSETTPVKEEHQMPKEANQVNQQAPVQQIDKEEYDALLNFTKENLAKQIVLTRNRLLGYEPETDASKYKEMNLSVLKVLSEEFEQFENLANSKPVEEPEEPQEEPKDEEEKKPVEDEEEKKEEQKDEETQETEEDNETVEEPVEENDEKDEPEESTDQATEEEQKDGLTRDESPVTTQQTDSAKPAKKTINDLLGIKKK